VVVVPTDDHGCIDDGLAAELTAASVNKNGAGL
jgi:hypothetical protein